MTFHFTIEDWKTEVKAADGQAKGLEIQFNQFNIEDPIIQVLKDFGGNRFSLVSPGIDFMVAFTNNNILVYSQDPFNGKLIIR